jgi:hypothetical protein
MKESRPVTTSDWKVGQDVSSKAPAVDLATADKATTVAQRLIDLGRPEEAQAVLEQAGISQPKNELNNALGLLDENNLLQAATKAGRWTAPDGTVYDGGAIKERIAKNNETLVGLRPVLARTPSVEGKVLNIRDVEPEHINKGGVNISGINRDVAARAEKSPGLLVVTQNGELMPAETFKYELLRDDANDGGLALGLGDRGYDASGKGAAKLAKDVVRGSVEGLRKANDYAANTLYQATKGVGRELYVPGTAIPVSSGWFKEFADGLGEDEDSK